MALFYGVLLMLGAILLSNLINRFVPSFSIPIIQILLGIVLSLLPSMYHFKFDTELFLILFLAPLLFHDGMQADKKSLWDLKKPIIMLALGLVFFTVAVVGIIIHNMIPSIPLAAAFALAAALAPTDAVAVSSLGKRIKIPEGIKNLLEGEALINDASGIVSFQFAVAAMVTGTFSLLHAGIQFLYVALGGVIIGVLMTGLKYLLVKWVRSLGMENITFHLLIGLLTPFLIYMAAEECRVSGILAVVISGVIHSFEGRKINPETATLNIASKSVWSTLAFALNGLVFLILGMQLPQIISVIWSDVSISNLETIGFILAITAAMMLIRFLWSFFTIGDITENNLVEKGFGRNSKKNRLQEKNSSAIEITERGKLSRIRTNLVISMSGVRGSVTLASILSLPFILSNGKAFPERDLIIFIAAGVILCSLLIANFLLPLLLKKDGIEEASMEEREACLEIIENVIRQMSELITDENKFQIGKVIRNLMLRSEELRDKNYKKSSQKEERNLRNEVLAWEEDYTNLLLKNNEIEEAAARHYLDFLSKVIRKNDRKEYYSYSHIGRVIRNMKHIKKRGFIPGNPAVHRVQMETLKHLNNEYVLKRLQERKNSEDTLAVNKLISEYERLEALLTSRTYLAGNRQGQGNQGIPPAERIDDKEDLVSLSFQMERDGIQAMYEQGRISWETARKMRSDIALMELQLRQTSVS
ncbi:Na+/H+ antiporter [Anaerocolumna xylanovorans]|uniref:Monovalent cation:H+ antiporter, CPA1 family n=1 Tax=Anaerocolumna xylanovorans DSM 12503 TaxID=1121345 RepID=A0A1M7XYZ2_9FIRM|nr:Na+/H+ antiporter [Anaerocolumna xylanovorans]SHO44358.1 monovalent cation:H+ antiporter, CPA1 family [Anaerocolumna xylanovorans DSM 12503]